MKKIQLFLALGLMLLTLNAQAGKTVNLSESVAGTQIEISDGDTVIGTLDVSCQVRVNYSNPTEKCTVLLDNVNIYPESGSVTVSAYSGLSCMNGKVTLIIKDECVVNSKHLAAPAIFIKEGCTVTIQEHEEGGELYAKSLNPSAYSAGIGGSSNGTGGGLIIKSGKIYAQGAKGAPGIGAGTHQTSGSFSTFGDITIEGGEVTAIGGVGAAGIGGGEYGKFGRILIKGGIVNATGGTNAPGLGCGAGSGSYCQIISIYTQKGVNLDITAIKGTGAPYSVGKSESGTCGSISLESIGAYQDQFTASPWRYDGTSGQNIDGIWYILSRVLGYVICDGRVNDALTQIVIKDTVQFGNYKYPVYNIGANKFSHNNITSVELPATIQRIYDNSFSDCSALTELKCKAETPPTLASGVFTNLPITTFIRVPNASYNAYKTADGWKEFANQLYVLEPEVTRVINGIRYDINLDAQTCTVVALPSPELYKDTVIIPEKIMCDGFECLVMAIGENAFAGCSNLKRVEIQGNTDFVAIGSMAFSQCSGLESLVCNAEIPPMLDGTAVFYHVPTTMVIYVPGKSVATYQGKSQWNDFIIRDIDYPAKKAELGALVKDMAALIANCDGGNFIPSDNAALVALTNAWGDANTVYSDESPTITIADVNQAINKATDDLNTALTDLLAAAKDRLTALVNDDFAPLKVAVQDVFQDNTLANQISGHATALATAIPTVTSVTAAKGLFDNYSATFEDDRDDAIAAAKTWGKSALDLLLEPGDSQACIDIVNNAKAEVDAMAWDDAKTTTENLAALKAQAEKIAKDTDDALKAQRESEKPVAVAVCDFTTKASKNSDYKKTWTYDDDWTVGYGANNNGLWDYVKMGGKSSKGTTYNPTFVANKTAITAEVNTVTVTYPVGSLAKTGMSLTEWGVNVYSDAARTSKITTVKGNASDITNAAAVLKIQALASQPWPAGSYYEVYWTVNNTSDNNGVICVSKIEFWKEDIATDIEQTNSQELKANSQKIFRNGQVLIIRDGRTYNILGAEVE